MKKRLVLPLLAAGLLSLTGWTYSSSETSTGAAFAAAVDSTLMKMYRWRNIGPADRGGRSIAISGVRGRPMEGYFGATGGGLWKTTDGGENWTPVTDGQITSASVGAVAVSETNPDVVWIGMGETCIRGNIMPGDGVYKSTDAGKTWTHMGFRGSDAIAKIRIHPKNPDVVFVASYGKYGADSEERGVFKSTDGGRTWRQVLYRDARTGAVDISIDQTNPDVIYAAMWESFRNEWMMSSGGPGSGLFKSTDGGETWREITRNQGLPAGVNGKIGVAVSPADPNRVYAIIENDNGGLFSSDDAGATWTLVNSNRNIRQRAFYYTHVNADPKNRDLVYLLNVSSYRSTDGGKTLGSFAGGDVHDLWINPDNTEHVLLANDRGGAITTNAGNPARTWTARDYPTTQIYRISATSHVPFHICGSQQDATSFCITTANPAAFGGGRGGRGGGGGGAGGGAPAGAPAIPMNYNVGGSENGYVTQDPLDPDVFYVGTNANGGGFLNRVNRRTGEEREVNPYPRMFSGEESGVIKERWQWTYPIVFSRLDPRALFVGSQRVWKSTNAGQDWTAISGDLTRHDPKTMGPSGGPITRDMNGPEVYGVVFTIAPSKRSANVIWAGSDDGLIHVTQNGGTTWANVTPKDSPEFGRVSIIDASNFETGTAYAAVKRPLLNDRAPYIFRTRDYGRTWTRIVTGIRGDDFVHSVREDPYKKGVLYAATHQGVYISFNDGELWESLSLNMPVLPATDLVVMPEAIAISTMGRGFWILENINPLRNGVAASAAGSAFLFTPTPAVRSSTPATIQYWLKRPAGSLRIEISDTTGRLVRSFLGGTAAPVPDPNAPQAAPGGGGGRGGFGAAAVPATTVGLNSVTWDLRYPNAVGFPGMILWGGGLQGPMAPPGRYRVKITADGYTQTEELVVKRNPMFAATDADLRAQFALAMQIRDKVSEANNAVITIRDLKAQIADRLAKSSHAALKTAGERFTADLFAVEGEIYQVKNQAGQDPLNYPIRINNRLASLMSGVVNSGDGRPVGKVPEIFVDLKAELKVLTDRLDRVIASGVPSFNAAAKTAGVEAIVVRKPGPAM